MVALEKHALQRDIKAQIANTTRTTFADASVAAFASSNSFRIVEGYNLEVEDPRVPRVDSIDSRDPRLIFPRMRSTLLEFATDIPLVGANGSPEIREALIAAIGAETVAGTTYSYVTGSPLVASNLLFEADGVIGEAVYGWVCNTLRILLLNKALARFEFAGPAIRSAHVASGLVSGPVDGSSTPVSQVTLATALEAGAFEIDGLIAFSGAVASDLAAHRVTSYNVDTGVVTFTPAITANLGITYLVPYTSYGETQTPSAGQIVPATTGDSRLEINGEALEFLDAEILLSNQFEVIASAGDPYPSDFCAGRRLITGQFNLHASASSQIRRILANNPSEAFPGASFISVSLAMGRGQTGDARCRVILPRVLCNRSALDYRIQDTAIFRLPFTALGSVDYGTADNAISIVFDEVT